MVKLPSVTYQVSDMSSPEKCLSAVNLVDDGPKWVKWPSAMNLLDDGP